MATTTKVNMRALKAGMIFIIEGREHVATCDAYFIGDGFDGEFIVEDINDCYFEHEFA